MGNAMGCCQQRLQLLDLESLSLLDPQIVTSIEELRKEHTHEIEQSYEISQGDRIFRGVLDQQKRKNGYGELFRGGLVYLGDFVNDQPSGYGILIKEQQEYYRGEFLEGRYHGRGKEFSQQHEFEGEFQHGWRRRGTLRTAELEYQGEFKDNNFHGHGHLTVCDGTSYDGMFQNGQYHGRGFLTFPTSNKYQGGFQEGRYHGQGKFTWADGVTSLSYFDKGQLKHRELFKNQPMIKPIPLKLIDEGKVCEKNEEEWFQFRQMKVVHGNGMLVF